MKKILIVDDHEQNIYLLETMLKGRSYAVVGARNGAEALERARTEKPDMIIADILMPVMDGFALCRECKADAALKDVPFVFYTATYTDPKDEELALNLGAARFIAKPVEPEVFTDAIEEVLQEYEAGRIDVPRQPLESEMEYFRLYNEALIRKLEDKMLQLDAYSRRLDTIAENAPDIIAELDPEGKVVYVNRTLDGLEKAQVIGTSFVDWALPEYWTSVKESIAQVLESKVATEYEVTAPGTHNEPRWYRVRMAPVLSNDEVTNLILVARDVTDRVLAERKISASEAEFRALFAAMQDLVLIIDRDGVYQNIAPTNLSLLIRPPDEILGKTLADVFPPQQAQEFLDTLRSVLETRQLAHIEYELSIGEQKHWFAASITPLDEDNTLWVVRDITRRKQTELENVRLLAESQQRLRRVEALHAIDLAISSSMDMSLSLNILLTEVANQLKVDAADVLLLDAHDLTVEYAAGRGFRTQSVKKARISVGESYAGKAIMERRMVRMAEIPVSARQAAFTEMWDQEGFKDYLVLPLIAKGDVIGVLEIFQRQPLALVSEWLDFLETLAGQASIAIDNARLLANVQRANTDLRLAYDATIEGWSRAMDLRDRETEGHTQRVTELALRLAQRMKVGDAHLIHYRRGALLHDIGKMGVPDHLLFKEGKLTDEEWAVMRMHPQYAFDMLSAIDYLKPALDIPYCHHEKWDGSGYPRGLKGKQIPLPARIFAVVDVWDAMTSDRPYRAALTEGQAMQYIREQSGKHFDPQVVEAFLVEIADRSR
jgi:PAS domain S-box-containing protein